MATRDVPVLIVGGSLVGLTASVLLGHHGVPHLLVERHRGTAIHPRAAAFHQRTTEIFRSVGLQREVEAAADREFVQNGAILAVDSLAGRETAVFYRNVNDGVEALSPARRLFITQIGLEPVLRAKAGELGAEHLFAAELASFEQDADGVTAVLRARDGGEEQIVRARYMIAADGTHSPVRKALGIAMLGRHDFAQCQTIYFKADVRDLIGDRNLSVVYVNQADLLAFFRFSIGGDAGFLAVFASDGRSHAELVRAALGVGPDFPVEIENVQPWTAAAVTAERFRDGRIFLAGDAAHIMPPTGGFGGNTGVADVHNLVWKLAMVLRGEAGEGLLDSYDAERRPIAALTVEQAYRRYVDRVDPSLPADNLAEPLPDPDIELGAIYPGAGLTDPFDPVAKVGARLPHVWLEPGRSSLDLAGKGFTLVGRNVPAGSFGLEPGGELLLRPDAVVAWRSDSGIDLDEALGRLGVSR